MLTIITSDTLSQLKYIIDQLTSEEYTKKLTVLNDSTIGQHVRHILEFYICLSEGFGSGMVDYDRRKRNMSTQNDPNYAVIILDDLISTFSVADVKDSSLTNMIEFNGVTISTDSSVGREMVYLIEHSIHHYAIIGIALRLCFKHIDIPQNFGVAHSTTKHNLMVSEGPHHHH